MQKVTLIIDLKRLLLLKKLKIVFCGHILLVILKLQKLFERFPKELQKINQTEFKVEKGIKKKRINYMSNGKVLIILLKV